MSYIVILFAMFAMEWVTRMLLGYDWQLGAFATFSLFYSGAAVLWSVGMLALRFRRMDTEKKLFYFRLLAMMFIVWVVSVTYLVIIDAPYIVPQVGEYIL